MMNRRHLGRTLVLALIGLPDEREGGSLDGFGIVAVALAAVAALGYARLQ